ncbi:hypothetical protein KEM60_01839 [Austwickia sp. TVS 96-490-7B]|uniref:Bax inhibitor-1/YccA family protein n=1 Tax=Austwickia sp. TVS 96-490-7B TaxID=2830843 RepID=UPI001C5957B5|nr:Bax inhibitor-1/YccA family protein [Austwickia sp. TVS 96-490-7B]MBW3085635.1 hypothetical protein [Austwickia sp. TVS 96-490-7B]
MSNPVFNRIDKQVQEGRYAGFGPGQTTSPQGYGHVPQGYGQQQYGQYGQYGVPSAEHLDQMYQAPSAGPVQTGRVTLDDVIMKTLGLFGLLVVMAAVAWTTVSINVAAGMLMWTVGMLGGLVVGLVIAFKKKISVPLIVAYAALEGMFVGAISRMLEGRYPGVVSTAVLATLCVFAAMFVGWKSGYIKVTAKSRRIVGMAVVGYMIFSLVSLVFSMVGGAGLFPFGSPLGIGLSLFVVGLAAYTLAMDFDTIDNTVRSGAPQEYSWLLAHGLIVSVVWLYLEILRLVSQLRD